MFTEVTFVCLFYVCVCVSMYVNKSVNLSDARPGEGHYDGHYIDC